MSSSLPTMTRPYTLGQFAILYSGKFGVDKEKMMDKLWGGNFLNHTTRK